MARDSSVVGSSRRIRRGLATLTTRFMVVEGRAGMCTCKSVLSPPASEEEEEGGTGVVDGLELIGAFAPAAVDADVEEVSGGGGGMTIDGGGLDDEGEEEEDAKGILPAGEVVVVEGRGLYMDL